MEALETLDRLVRQYGIRPEFAWSLKGLVERAQQATPAVAERLMRLVERTASAEGHRELQRVLGRLHRPEQDLTDLARQLHGWTPAHGVGDWTPR